MVLSGLKYTKEHEWLKIEGNKAFMGITDYAQHALGSLVYLELPEVDDTFGEGETLGVVESVKAASDLFMPISGVILEVNEAVVDDPGLINSDAYGSWMVSFEITDASQLDDLLDPAAYEALIG
jgi:glycine cleavage system H protein